MTTRQAITAQTRAQDNEPPRTRPFHPTTPGTGEARVEALRLAEAFRARVIDATTESFVFEIAGSSAKISQFIDLMRPLGLVEVSRTGVAAIGRGPEGM